MNHLGVSIETVVGNSTEKRWSQAHGEIFASGALGIFVVVNISGGELMDLAHFGSSMIEAISSGTKELSNRSLEGIKKVVEKSVDEMPEGVEFSVLAGLVNGEILYVVGQGEIDAILGRDGEMVPVFEGKQEIKSVSGKLNSGDRLVVGTHDFLGVISDELFEKVMNNGHSPRELLAPSIVSEDDSSGMAGAVVMVGSEHASLVNDQVSESKGERDAMSVAMSAIKKPKLKLRGEGNKKRSMLIGTVLFVALMVSVVFGYIKRSSIIKETSIRELEQLVGANMSEVESVADINPQRAEFLIDESRALVDSYLDDEGDSGYPERARELYSLINDTESRALKIAKVNLDTLIGMSLLSNDFSPKGMYFDGEGILYVYGSGDLVYGVGVEDKSTVEVEGMSEVRDIAVYDEEVYGARADDVIRSDGNIDVLIENDDFWEDIAYIDVYGGNVYLLDKGAGEIWSYPRLDTGYGARRRWLGTGIVLDLSNVSDMKIDGDIWIVTSTGKLERYSRGVPVDFSTEGLPSDSGNLNNPISVFLTEDKVYVLEKGASRVVVFSMEEGGFLTQYVNQEFSGGIEVAVFEDKGYVLLEDKIVSFGL